MADNGRYPHFGIYNRVSLILQWEIFYYWRFPFAIFFCDLYQYSSSRIRNDGHVLVFLCGLNAKP